MSAKGGFSLLEMLVASLLLGMIVGMLTTLMNQSAIAWRAGSASVTELGAAHQMAVNLQNEADNALPRLSGSQRYYTVSPWDENGKLRKRAVDRTKWITGTIDRPDRDGWSRDLEGDTGSRAGGFIVGVTSAGPDRFFNTDDDITSWQGSKEE